MSKASLSSGIEKCPVSGPPAHDELHLSATSWAYGDKRCWGRDMSWLERDVGLLCDHPSNGIGFDGTIRIHKAEVTDFHQAIGQDVLQEPADKIKRVEAGGTLPNTSGFAVGERDDTAFERDDTAIGDGDLEDIRGEVFESRVAIGVGLTVHIPGDVPDLGSVRVKRSACCIRSLKTAR